MLLRCVAGVEALMKKWCDDAVYLMPGASPMEGKQAIQALLRPLPATHPPEGRPAACFTGS